PLGDGLMDLRRGTGVALAAWLSVFAGTLVLSVYFVGRVLSRLARREWQMVALDRQLAHSEKLASVGTLAAGVAHEINNPGGGTRNRVELRASRGEAGARPGVLLEALGVVEKHAQRIGPIPAGLLAFSREAPFTLVRVDLNRLVSEGLDLVSVPFRAARVELQ